MNRNTFTIFALILLAIAAGAVWYLVHTSTVALHPGDTSAATTTDMSLSGLAIYTNGEYGFTLHYPDTAQVEDTFTTYYHLPGYWRVSALNDATGTPIVSIATYRIQSENSYPRYFDAEVRVGASSDPKEVAGCLKATPDQGETALPDRMIHGISWKAFAFESAGMMQYEKGISYRTMHNGRCVALEQIQTGSSYRDDPPSAKDVPDVTLQARYGELDAIIQSFAFAT